MKNFNVLVLERLIWGFILYVATLLMLMLMVLIPLALIVLSRTILGL